MFIIFNLHFSLARVELADVNDMDYEPNQRKVQGRLPGKPMGNKEEEKMIEDFHSEQLKLKRNWILG